MENVLVFQRGFALLDRGGNLLLLLLPKPLQSTSPLQSASPVTPRSFPREKIEQSTRKFKNHAINFSETVQTLPASKSLSASGTANTYKYIHHSRSSLRRFKR
jgi:hypothetical protein